MNMLRYYVGHTCTCTYAGHKTQNATLTYMHTYLITSEDLLVADETSELRIKTQIRRHVAKKRLF